MPTNYTNNLNGFVDGSSPSTYVTESYTWAMGTIPKSTDDAPETRSLYLGALVTSLGANRYIQADFVAGTGWVINEDEDLLTPAQLNTALDAIPANFVGATITADDYAIILALIGLS